MLQSVKGYLRNVVKYKPVSQLQLWHGHTRADDSSTWPKFHFTLSFLPVHTFPVVLDQSGTSA